MTRPLVTEAVLMAALELKDFWIDTKCVLKCGPGTSGIKHCGNIYIKADALATTYGVNAEAILEEYETMGVGYGNRRDI